MIRTSIFKRGARRPSPSIRGKHRHRLTSAVAALALVVGGAALGTSVAQAGTTPPFTIGPDGQAEVPGADGPVNLPDLFGAVKELGPLNSSTTKIGVIHNDAVPTLGLTNPNSQVDLRQAWVGTQKDGDQDDWVYFAWERDANNGSGFIAFEFMKNAAPAACAFGPNQDDDALIASCNPWKNRVGDDDGTGPHVGDFMILWDQQGGSKDLWLRQWQGTAPNLTLSAPALIPASFGQAAYSQNGFRGEAAINITQTIFGGQHTCLAFANIIPSTVTGNSDTADYKDTILTSGINLSNCSTTTVTTPQLVNGTTTSTYPAGGQSIGTDGLVQVKDSALISLAGGSSAAGGSVDFTLCQASDTSNATCDTGGPSVLVGNDVAVSGTYPVTVTSPSAWVTSVGRYCWKAVYTPAANSGIGGSSDVGTGECFVVTPVTPTLSTTAGADVTLGSAISDTASLTGTAPRPTTAVIETTAPAAASRTAAGGTITFTLFGPASGSCGTQVTGATQQVTVSGDNTAYGPATFTPTTAGDYHWKASYTGDSPNTNAQSHNAGCTEQGEDVTVGPAATTTETTPRVGSTPISAPVAVGTSVTDHAVVTGTAAGGSPTGTVSFFVCSPSQLDANGLCGSGGASAGANKPLSAGTGNTATADSDAVVADAVGTWCFRAVYSSDTANYTGSSDSRATECFTVKDTTSASSAQDWLPNDTATITASGGTALNGTLTFTLYSGDNCGATSGAALGYTKSFTLTNASTPADRTKSTDNTAVKVLASGSVSWLVEFTSTDSLVAGSSHCEKTSLVITN